MAMSLRPSQQVVAEIMEALYDDWSFASPEDTAVYLDDAAAKYVAGALMRGVKREMEKAQRLVTEKDETIASLNESLDSEKARAESAEYGLNTVSTEYELAKETINEQYARISGLTSQVQRLMQERENTAALHEQETNAYKSESRYLAGTVDELRNEIKGKDATIGSIRHQIKMIIVALLESKASEPFLVEFLGEQRYKDLIMALTTMSEPAVEALMYKIGIHRSTAELIMSDIDLNEVKIAHQISD